MQYPTPVTSHTDNGNPSGSQMLKQYVWGLQYIDELCQIGVNQDPNNATYAHASGSTENDCEFYYYALQDANYNVLGVVTSGSWGTRLAERYEYTPYGQRTVYSHGYVQGDVDNDGFVGIFDLNAVLGAQDTDPGGPSPLDINGDGYVTFTGDTNVVLGNYNKGISPAANNDPLVTHARLQSARFTSNGVAGYGPALCEVGHQGKMHDEESGLIHYPYRDLNPRLGWIQRDPIGYAGGMNFYEFVLSNPINLLDPLGLKDYKLGTDDPTITPDPGAGAHGSNPNNWGEWWQKQSIRVLKEVFRGWPDARAHLAHYFGNSRTTYTIRLQKMIDDVQSAKDLRKQELDLAKAFVETLDEGTHDITSGSPSGGYNLKSESSNWYYAVGGYAAWGKGKAKVECGDDGVYTYTLDYEYKFFDRYNWDTGKSVTINVPLYGSVVITDKFMGDMHRAGVAKEFDMTGSVTDRVVWRSDGSKPPSPPPPPPPGRGGPGR